LVHFSNFGIFGPSKIWQPCGPDEANKRSENGTFLNIYFFPGAALFLSGHDSFFRFEKHFVKNVELLSAVGRCFIMYVQGCQIFLGITGKKYQMNTKCTEWL
jgi:hypothetical protein